MLSSKFIFFFFIDNKTRTLSRQNITLKNTESIKQSITQNESYLLLKVKNALAVLCEGGQEFDPMIEVGLDRVLLHKPSKTDQSQFFAWILKKRLKESMQYVFGTSDKSS